MKVRETCVNETEYYGYLIVDLLLVLSWNERTLCVCMYVWVCTYTRMYCMCESSRYKIMKYGPREECSIKLATLTFLIWIGKSTAKLAIFYLGVIF